MLKTKYKSSSKERYLTDNHDLKLQKKRKGKKQKFNHKTYKRSFDFNKSDSMQLVLPSPEG